MNRKEFEEFKEKRLERESVIKTVIYATCFFCGIIILCYFLFVDRKPKSFTDVNGTAPTAVPADKPKAPPLPLPANKSGL